MKSIIKNLTFFGAFFCCVVLFSCNIARPMLATIRVEKKQDLVVAPDNLKTFLKNHSKLSVVLRTPQSATTDITQAQESSKAKESEQSWLNKVYDALEQALMLNGFDVKDRAMVTNVMGNINRTAADQTSGAVIDYAKIGKILNVDLFIEITTPPRLLYEKPDNYKIKETNASYNTNSLDAAYIEFAYRLVIAETGSVGGMFKVYQQTCTDGCEFYVLQQQYETKFQEKRYAGTDMFARSIYFGFASTSDEIASYFANQLVNSLKNK